MKKLKIYLDTSVISHLDAPDTPEKMEDTLALWKEIKAGKYEVVISDVTSGELEDCSSPKKEKMQAYLKEIVFAPCIETVEAKELALKYIEYKVLTSKSFDDCRHIASAIIANCDMIVSWNFRHLVNHKTIVGVKAVNALDGYREIFIYSPSMLLGENDYE